MPKLILIRGVSGSGKSTIAKKILAEQENKLGSSHFETDQFFGAPGTYQFDPKFLPKAHGWCRLQVEQAMQWFDKLIVVSNTFTRLWEMQPYFDLAVKNGYEVEVFVTPKPWIAEELFKRNIHNVPLHIIYQQINRFETFASEKSYEEKNK